MKTLFILANYLGLSPFFFIFGVGKDDPFRDNHIRFSLVLAFLMHFAVFVAILFSINHFVLLFQGKAPTNFLPTVLIESILYVIIAVCSWIVVFVFWLIGVTKGLSDKEVTVPFLTTLSKNAIICIISVIFQFVFIAFILFFTFLPDLGAKS